MPRSARTAETLGAEREGTGVLIDGDGLILTIGYLLLEADSVLVVASDGRVMPASIVGFDHCDRLRPGARARSRSAARRSNSAIRPPARELTTAMIAAHPGAGGLSCVSIVSRRRFTGWWEYALDDAIFTAPARDNHSGAALINADGQLIGIGSLWVGDAIDEGAAFPGNMFVPTDLLLPIMPDLVAHGRRRDAIRPWLGVYSEEVRGHVLVTQVLRGAPADLGGLQARRRPARDRRQGDRQPDRVLRNAVELRWRRRRDHAADLAQQESSRTQAAFDRPHGLPAAVVGVDALAGARSGIRSEPRAGKTFLRVRPTTTSGAVAASVVV